MSSRIIEPGCIESSGIVSKTPCLLYSICGIGIADADNVYRIHDGHSTADKPIFRLVAGQYSADFRLFAEPLHFTKGLYVDFSTNGAEVFFQILRLLTVEL